MHKAVPAFTIQHYISHTLLINFNYRYCRGLKNSRDQCFKTKTETAEFQSWDQNRGLEDYKTETNHNNSVTYLRYITYRYHLQHRDVLTRFSPGQRLVKMCYN